MSENHPSNLRQLTEEEIKAKIASMRGELFNLRFRNAVKQLDNPLKIREVRRNLARMVTLLNENRKGIRSLADHGGPTR